MTGFPAPLADLAARYDPSVFATQRQGARVRLQGAGPQDVDALLEGSTLRLAPADERRRPDAILRADPATWRAIAADLGGGMAAFRSGRLRIRHDLHLGVGLLAATAQTRGPDGLRFHTVKTRMGAISAMEAGRGAPVVLLHGLGATKASFLPTVAVLAPDHRVIAIDLLGFGDSDKPIAAAYDAPFFARSVEALLDALELDRAHLVGNSMGGRVALEAGLRTPQRVRRLVLLAPSLAWLHPPAWVRLLRFTRPELGLVQPAPRRVVEGIVNRLMPDGAEGWTAAGVDEFLRSYLTRRGRAAFYAAARNIPLEAAHGPAGFWTRLASLEPPALFVWGRADRLVPVGFAGHVRRVLPRAEHLELSCGHVPQLERPQATHRAMRAFLERPLRPPPPPSPA
jgi:pimeloyl-ACP methyl ester carboxylesterase